ncbi:NUDIX hydrolase [Fictibacillus phosphorivorans]|uniref:NUDIX hydrolase n=1 Tax=Fictibacillus phosphorivorans TaxID=1221500 RepID=UPI0012930B57|nr:NUDIX domain-containing protein [Fictibacillus phosphorivorans]MQR94466.1 NUDIX domain-containing protein [Fictibacillus phosphorivorans]
MSQDGIVLVVTVTIVNDEKVLIIRENKVNALNKWTFPGGHIEYGEDILYAAQREVKEETGLDIKLLGSTGVYNFISNTNDQVILFHFIGEIVAGEVTLEEDEINDSMWIKIDDFANFKKTELREPHVLKQILDNLLQNKVHSISFYNEKLFGPKN